MLTVCLWAALASKPCVDMGRTVGIVVPYRDRPVHLRRFASHMAAYWRREFPCDSMWVYVIEQDDALPFRRAALCNVGIKEVLAAAHKKHVIVDCIVFHDVDLVPDPGVPYTTCTHPTSHHQGCQHCLGKCAIGTHLCKHLNMHFSSFLNMYLFDSKLVSFA